MSRRPGARPDLNKHRWAKQRARAKQRDGNRCRRCGVGVRLQVHHKRRPEDGGSDALENLITLCPGCHALEHKAMGKGRKRFHTVGGVVQPENAPPPRSPGEYPSPADPPREKELSPDYEDDPENGIFWGPKQPNGMMTRWSRPWFDWRNEQRSRA